MLEMIALPVLGFLCFWRLASAYLARLYAGDEWSTRLLFGLEGAILALLVAYTL